MVALCLAVAEQFTYFNTVRSMDMKSESDHRVISLVRSRNLSPATVFSSRFALQVNVPFIYRSFGAKGFAIDRGTESGLGDVSLLTKVRVALHTKIGGRRAVNFADAKSPRMEVHEPNFTRRSFCSRGTDSSQPRDPIASRRNFEEIEMPGAPESGIHGHDLTLGSGSYDGIFGGRVRFVTKVYSFKPICNSRFVAMVCISIISRTISRGAGGPGYYFIRNGHTIVGLQFVVSGEHRTSIVFAARKHKIPESLPRLVAGIVASLGKVSAELGTDLPVSIDNTALQVVPDYRIRGGIAIRF